MKIERRKACPIYRVKITQHCVFRAVLWALGARVTHNQWTSRIGRLTDIEVLICHDKISIFRYLRNRITGHSDSGIDPRASRANPSND